MIYGYGIDAAHTLNYCGIVITRIEDRIRLVKVCKLRGISYPEITRVLFDDFFKKYPPRYICTDYTNERSFSHTIEARLNPGFDKHSSAGFFKWKHVNPVVFTMDTKLEMKQNAREMMENKDFVWPKKNNPLVEELKEQMLREAGQPALNGKMKFPKPEGHDNDLIMALELNLFGAKKHLPRYAFKIVCRKLKGKF